MAATETDEIEKIMSEIEELQKEMSSETPAAEAPAVATQPTAEAVPTAATQSMATVEEDILSEIQAQARASGQTEEGASGGLEDTLADLKEEAPTGGMLDEISHEETEETMPKEEQGNDGTLSLTLTGNMTLKLKYDFEGQEVTISFADQSLRVQMTDGTEFKVPVVRGTTTSSSSSNVKPFKKVV